MYFSLIARIIVLALSLDESAAFIPHILTKNSLAAPVRTKDAQGNSRVVTLSHPVKDMVESFTSRVNKNWVLSEVMDKIAQGKTDQVVPSLYLNVMVINTDAVVAQKINATFPTPGPLGRITRKIGPKLVPEQLIAAGVSKKIQRILGPMLSERGVISTVEQAFLFQNYFVMKIDLSGVDNAKFLGDIESTDTSGEKSSLPEFTALDSQDGEELTEKVIRWVQGQVEETLVNNLSEDGILVKVVARSTSQDQADFFYPFLRDVKLVKIGLYKDAKNIPHAPEAKTPETKTPETKTAAEDVKEIDRKGVYDDLPSDVNP